MGDYLATIHGNWRSWVTKIAISVMFYPLDWQKREYFPETPIMVKTMVSCIKMFPQWFYPLGGLLKNISIICKPSTQDLESTRREDVEPPTEAQQQKELGADGPPWGSPWGICGSLNDPAKTPMMVGAWRRICPNSKNWMGWNRQTYTIHIYNNIVCVYIYICILNSRVWNWHSYFH